MTSTFDDAAVVARRSARLSALLAATDEAPRRIVLPEVRIQRAAARGVFVRRLRIAAAAALLLVGAGVPPVRAWIVGSARIIWNVVSPRHAAPQPAPVAAPATPGAMGSVTLPVTESFMLRITTRQAKGSLTIEFTADSLASATVTGERDAAELVVLPDGLRIVDRPASTAGYLVRLPSRVSKLTVQVGRETVLTRQPVGDQGMTIDLAARRNAH